MKNTIKRITAAVSAAVMCALPMAGNLSANAAQQYTTFRNTYFIKYENANIKEANLALSTKKGLTKVARTEVNDTGYLGTPHGNGGPNFDAINISWIRYPGTYNISAFNDKGILFNDTTKTTYGGNFEQYISNKSTLKLTATDINGGRADERVGYFSVNVGDVTGAWNSTSFTDFKADGITNKDANEVSKLIKNGYTNIFAYSKRVDYSSANNESLKRLRAMIAADINNDGKLTENDATVIMYWGVGKVKDFSVFEGVDDSRIVDMAKNMK